MELQPIEVIKNDERGIIYYCGKSNFIARKAGTTNKGHLHPEKEIFYLVKGSIEVTVAEETQIIEAPISVVIAPNVFHKVTAITDFEMVIDREGVKK